jgi:hypothetical protein
LGGASSIEAPVVDVSITTIDCLDLSAGDIFGSKNKRTASLKWKAPFNKEN